MPPGSVLPSLPPGCCCCPWPVRNRTDEAHRPPSTHRRRRSMTSESRRTLLGLGAAATGLYLPPAPRVPAQPAAATPALDVPYVPTPQEVVDRMLQLAKVGKNDVLYDLGCGDGRIVVTAAKTYGARCTGIDLDPERIA